MPSVKGMGSFQIAPHWERIDGVRTPVLVCPNRKTFDKVVPAEAWHDEVKTTMIQCPRPVFACDDYNPVHFGGKLPRIAQARTRPVHTVHLQYMRAGALLSSLSPGCPRVESDSETTSCRLTSQMYRDPFNLVISSYNYHTQHPQPDKWMYHYKNPAPPSENTARCVVRFIDLSRRREFRGSLRLTPHLDGAAKPRTRTLPSSCASRLAI